MTKLKQSVIDKVKDSEEVQMKIALHIKRKFRTVYLWVLKNDEMLTAPAVLDIIREHFGFSENDELTEVVKVVKRIGKQKQAA